MNEEFIVDDLLNYEEKIYKSLEDLKKQDKLGLTNNEVRKNKIKYTYSYTLKESILLKQLLNLEEIEDPEDLVEIAEDLLTYIDTLEIDEKEKESISKRLSNYFNNILKYYDKQNKYHSTLTNRDLNIEEYQKELETKSFIENDLIEVTTIIDASTPYEIEGMKDLKYKIIFENKTLGDKIINNNLNPLYLDKNNIDQQSAQLILANQMTKTILRLIDTNENQDNIEDMIKYQYIINNVDKPIINESYKFLETLRLVALNNEDKELIEYLEGPIIKAYPELAKQEINVESYDTITPETLDKLIDLIKHDAKMYQTYKENIKDNKKIDELTKQYEEEQKKIKELNIKPEELPKTLDLIFNDIELFIDDEETQDEVQNRLTEEIPDILESIKNSSQTDESYLLIEYDHIYKSINKFLENRKITPETKQIIYGEIFQTKKAFDDYIFLKGNTKMLTNSETFTKYIISHGKDNFIYEIDKDEELTSIGEEIISYLLTTDLDETTSYIKEYYQYKECELNDILENISQENISYLESVAEENQTKKLQVKFTKDTKTKKNKAKILVKHTK